MNHALKNPVHTRLHRMLRELHWINELGTVAPCGCNDQIKAVGNLSNPSYKSTNALAILTSNNDERQAMDIGITAKSSLARFKYHWSATKGFTKLVQCGFLLPS